MKCLKCGFENAEGSTTCAYCRSSLGLTNSNNNLPNSEFDNNLTNSVKETSAIENQVQEEKAQENINYQQTDNSVITESINQQTVNPSGNNNQSNNKKTYSIVKIIIYVIVLILIITGLFLYFSKKNDNSNSNNKSIKNRDYTSVNFSESRDENNIAIPLRRIDGDIVLKINGEKFGSYFKRMHNSKGYTQSYYWLENEAFKIYQYFSANDESLFKIEGLWGSDYVVFRTEKYDIKKINNENTYNIYSIVENKDNYYLIANTDKLTNTIDYEIVIVLGDDVIRIGSIEFDENKTKSKEFYDMIVNNTELCYIPLGDDGDFKQAVKYKGSDEAVDVSNWTFIQTLLADRFQKDDLLVKKTTFIETFNSAMYKLGDISYFYYHPTFNLNNEIMTVGIVIKDISSTLFEKLEDPTKLKDYEKNTFSNIKEINLSQFKKAYVVSISGNACVYVKTYKDEYYLLDTYIPYSYKSETDFNKVYDIINLTFN